LIEIDISKIHFKEIW